MNKIMPRHWQLYNQMGGQIVPHKQVALEQQNDEFKKEKEKNKKLKNFIIGSSLALVISGYTAVFYRKNILNAASEFVKKMYLKKDSIKQHGINGLSKLEVLSYEFARLIDKTLTSTQMLVNFSAMKDSISNRMAHFFRLGKMCDKLTNFWEKLASKAVTTNYQKSDKSLKKTHLQILNIVEKIKNSEDLSKVIQVNGKNYTLNEILTLVEKNMRDSRNLYNQNFSISAFENRKKILKESLQKASEKFQETYTNIDYYKDLEFTKFTVEEWLAPVKTAYQGHILEHKMKISNSLDDKFVNTYQLLKTLDKIIAPKDTSSRKILKGVFKQLKEYRYAIGKDEGSTRELLHTDIERHLDLLLKKLEKDSVTYSSETIANSKQIINGIKISLSKNDKGKLQETLTYLKAILPKSEYEKIRKQVNTTANNLTNITTAEGDLYFDKLRDITLGSAFSDIVFGMVSPLATMGVVLALDDNNEERLSTTLKLGIPLIGGIATSTAFLFLLASGGKALILSSLIGFGLNRIGTYADSKIAQNRNNEKNADIKKLINDVNLTSTLLASGGSDVIIQKVMNKSYNELSKHKPNLNILTSTKTNTKEKEDTIPTVT